MFFITFFLLQIVIIYVLLFGSNLMISTIYSVVNTIFTLYLVFMYILQHHILNIRHKHLDFLSQVCYNIYTYWLLVGVCVGLRLRSDRNTWRCFI